MACKSKGRQEEQVKSSGLISNYIGRPFRWWVRGFTSAGKAALCLPGHRAAIELTRGACQKIRNHFHALHQPRTLNAPDAPNMMDFDQVLQHWGISRQELPIVIKALRIQIILFVIFWCLAVCGAASSIRWQVPLGIFVSILLLICTSTVIICRTWRLQVLRQQAFVSFFDWLRGRDLHYN